MWNVFAENLRCGLCASRAASKVMLCALVLLAQHKNQPGSSSEAIFGTLEMETYTDTWGKHLLSWDTVCQGFKA